MIRKQKKKLLKTEPASKKQRLNWEKELLGLYISDHPAREYKEYFSKMAMPIKDIDNETVGQNVTLGGVITGIHKIYLKTQKTMLFVTIEDVDSKIEILVFPKILENTGAVWEEEKVVLVSGKISNKDGVFKLLCDNATVVNQEEMEKFKRVSETQKANGVVPRKEDAKNHTPTDSKIIITLPPNSNPDILKKLSVLFDSCELGATKIFLAIGDKKIQTPYCINNIEGLQEKIQAIIGEGKVFVTKY